MRKRRRDQRLTVAVDVTPLWESLTGVGWYLFRILERLTHVENVAIRLYGPNQLIGEDVPDPVVRLPEGPAIEHVVYEVPHDLALRPGLLMKFMQLAEPLLVALDRNRVLFAPNYFLPRKFKFARGRVVTTIHDLGSRKVPHTLAEETLTALEDNLRRSTARAQRIITVSAAVRDELVDLGYAPREAIDVVHHGPGQLAEVEATEIPESVRIPYVLHVGTLEPRKNVLGLLAVWEILRGRDVDVPLLVLCGRYGWKADELRKAVGEAEAAGWALHLGYVGEGELAALYRNATLVAFPTLYEGFGLPAVEAQQAGAPLVCSDLPVLHEVAGDGAAYAPPDDPEAFADAVEALLKDPDARRSLAERGRRNAAGLSWQRAAEQTVDTWTRAAAHPVEAAR